MRRFILLFKTTCILAAGVFAQSNVVDVNNMAVFINNNGTLSFDELESHFEVPKDSGIHSIFAGQLWMGGIDTSGGLHLAAQTYMQTGNDFWAGPIADEYTAAVYADAYDRVWVVSKSVIDNHIANWDAAGYVMPDEINDWPGNGNTLNGEAEFLAPFYDYNVNDVYDPENGDYPIIRGDEALFFMMNDDADAHTESGGEKLKVEIHGMLYAFDAVETDTALNHTVFLHYEVINRSVEDYDDFYLGAWIDFDLGCYIDDWVGCDSSLNMFYSYNGDGYDDFCPAGYGSSTPAQGFMFLNESMSSFMYFDNEFTVTGNPVVPEDYYNYLHATWKDGTHLTYGDDGYGGTTETDFTLPSYPEEVSGWSELTASNLPSDRRGVGATGPFVFQAGESICLDIALPFASRPGITNTQAPEVLKLRAETILDFYNTNFSTCKIENEINPDFEPEDTSTAVLHIENDVIYSAYPNPAKDEITISVTENMSLINGSIEISTIYGEKVYAASGLDISDMKINTSSFKSGVYLYKITDENKMEFTGKFTIQQ